MKWVSLIVFSWTFLFIACRDTDRPGEPAEEKSGEAKKQVPDQPQISLLDAQNELTAVCESVENKSAELQAAQNRVEALKKPAENRSKKEQDQDLRAVKQEMTGIGILEEEILRLRLRVIGLRKRIDSLHSGIKH